ncbi:MAG: WbqC family protein [Bacteroidetes bacterium]|nr:WbqC family protein [Bacteroidota bacterium]
MKLGIMQPYFFPYIGYFQLMYAVDEFVVYDNIEYTKKGWINRNRILVNGQDAYITLPLKKDSDILNVKDRFLADSWEVDRKKMLNRIKESYSKAIYFHEVFPLIEECILFDDKNLFNFILHSIEKIKNHLSISCSVTISSALAIDHTKKAQQKVLEICKNRKADIYINPIGGVELYSKENFAEQGIALSFIKSNDIHYRQFNNEFIPWLSIIDVMMFNTKEQIEEMLKLKQVY